MTTQKIGFIVHFSLKNNRIVTEARTRFVDDDLRLAIEKDGAGVFHHREELDEGNIDIMLFVKKEGDNMHVDVRFANGSPRWLETALKGKEMSLYI